MRIRAISLFSLSMSFAALFSYSLSAQQAPPDATYRQLPTEPFDTVKAKDEAEKPTVMQKQQTLFQDRYDLSDKPIQGVMMSGGRKPVQGGVRSSSRRA